MSSKTTPMSDQAVSSKHPIQARSIPSIATYYTPPVAQAVPSMTPPFGPTVSSLPLNRDMTHSKTSKPKKRSNTTSSAAGGSQSHSLQLPRIQYPEMLLKIERVLDSRSSVEEYCIAIMRYLNAKLSKSELDNCVVKLFGWDNAYLHNELFFAILHNAACSERPHNLNGKRVSAVSCAESTRKRDRSIKQTPKAKKAKPDGPSITVPEHGLGIQTIKPFRVMQHDTCISQLEHEYSNSLMMPTRSYLRSVIDHYSSISRIPLNTVSSGALDLLEKGLVVFLKRVVSYAGCVDDPWQFLQYVRPIITKRSPALFELLQVRLFASARDPLDVSMV